MPVDLEEEPTSLAAMMAQDAPAETPAEETADSTEAESESTSEATETETEGEETEEKTSENPILDYYRECFPDDPSIAKYASDDEFLKGYRNAQKLVGQKEEAVETIRYLEKEGVTPRELSEWLQQRKQAPAAAKDNPASDPSYFDPDWVVENENGEWVATAKNPLPPAELAARAKRYRAEISARLRDPAKMAREVMKYLTPEVQAMLSQSQAQTAAALAQRDDAQVQADFIDRHAAVLFAEGKPNSSFDNWNPIAHRVSAIAQELSEKSYPTLQARLERALQIAALETTPKPNTAKLPSAAKHVATPSVPAKSKMSEEDVESAWPDMTLAEWTAFDTKGKIPDRPRTGKKK